MDNSGSGRGQAETEPNMTFLDLGDKMITRIPYVYVLDFLWGETNTCKAWGPRLQ